MSIWLGFPEGSNGEGAGAGTDNIQTIIDDIQTKDQEVDQAQDQLVVELQKLDGELKTKEKEEFVTEAELTSDGRASAGSGIEPITVTDETTWTEIISAYNKAWGLETGPKKDSLEGKLFRIEPVMDNKWEYGNQRIPHGTIAVTTGERVNAAYTGNVKTKIDDVADKLIEINDKMKELVQELENERTEAEGGGAGAGEGTNANQNILEAVKNMKAIKINTVTNVITDDNRWLVEHQVPGRAGVDSEVSASVIQDLGRRPAKMEFKGVLTAETENRQELHKKIETLKWFYKQRKPLFFSSRFVNQIEATKVVIEKLNFEETDESPYAVNFNCVLKEYSEVNWKADTDRPPEKLTNQTNHWAQYQALKAMVGYRNRFVEEDETTSSSEVGKRIANFVIGLNGRIKHISTQSTTEEAVRPSDLLAPTANLNEAVDFYDGQVEDVVAQQEAGIDSALEGFSSDMSSATDSGESSMGGIFGTINDKLSDEIDAGAEKLNGVIEEGATTVKDWIGDVADEANSALDKAEEKLGSLLDSVDSKLDDALLKSQTKLKEVLERYGINIPDEKLDAGRKKIEELIEKGKGKLKEKIGDARDKAGEYVEAGKEKLNGLVDKAQDQASKAVDSAKEKLEEAIEKGAITAEETISKARESLDKGADDLTADVGSIVEETTSKMDEKQEEGLKGPLDEAETNTDSKMDKAKDDASSSVESTKEAKASGGAPAAEGAAEAAPAEGVETAAPEKAPAAEEVAPEEAAPTEKAKPPEEMKAEEAKPPEEAAKEAKPPEEMKAEEAKPPEEAAKEAKPPEEMKAEEAKPPEEAAKEAKPPEEMKAEEAKPPEEAAKEAKPPKEAAKEAKPPEEAKPKEAKPTPAAEAKDEEMKKKGRKKKGGKKGGLADKVKKAKRR